MRDRGRRLRAEFGAESEQQRFVVRERHAVHLPSVALDLRDEVVLVLGAGFEPAVAMKHRVHKPLETRVGKCL